MAVSKVRRNDPCPCKSGKKFKNCCGQGVKGDRFMSDVISITGSTTHHYFIASEDFEPVRDFDGKILVFTDRGKATAWGHSHTPLQCPEPFAVVGMGDEKWAMFQRDEAGNYKIQN